tara:strand:+ start:505 stop:726 length:222 start_codon:yes stop_codon:yes gene_type:complete
MNANSVRRSLIVCAMHRKKVNKKELARFLNLSYPTMLHKLKNPEEFKIGQAKKLCEYLNIELHELITLKNYKQ